MFAFDDVRLASLIIQMAEHFSVYTLLLIVFHKYKRLECVWEILLFLRDVLRFNDWLYYQ